MNTKVILASIVMTGVVACSDTHVNNSFSQQIEQCLPSEGFNPVCTFKNPEDLVLLPDNKTLLVSGMGEFMTDATGELSTFDLTEGIKLPIEMVWENKLENWGQQNCSPPNPSLFSPHGIDIVQREDGKYQVLVVNHGGRESVELFDLIPNVVNNPQTKNDSDNTPLFPKWTLFWRGCAQPPGDPFLNDVVGLSNGGFLVTHMWDKSHLYATLVLKYLLGIETGWVWGWQQERGFQRVGNSSGVAPNGIAIDRRASIAYINMYGQNQLVALNLTTSERIAEVDVQQPDNVTLDDDGMVWIASHKHNPVTEDCKEVTSGPCLLPFEIVKFDPNSLKATPIVTHLGTSMGYATVALNHGGTLYIGSAHGDRIVTYSLSQ